MSEVERLFRDGKAFSIPPLRIVYALPDDQKSVPLRVLITVSSRRFKKAVDRNRIRRKIREAYRLNKKGLYKRLLEKGSRMIVGIIYIGNDAAPDFSLIESSLVSGLGRLERNELG